VVKTKSAVFLGKMTGYVVAKRTGVTDGYGQGSAVCKKMTALEAACLLGCSEAYFFLTEFCYGWYDKRALLQEALGGIM
jgi:hypothetical protein